VEIHREELLAGSRTEPVVREGGSEGKAPEAENLSSFGCPTKTNSTFASFSVLC